MAAMVARGSSPLASSVSIQEKGSRNKRKFRADPPTSNPSMMSLSPSSQTDCSKYEVFPIDKDQETLELEHLPGMCDLCRNHSFVPQRDDLEREKFQEADWNDRSETQLEQTLLSNLDLIFKTAIKTIVSCGYSEETAMNAVLSGGLCLGCKDMAANVVKKALGLLRSGHEVGSWVSEDVVEELRKMERSVLNEMLSVLRECRPLLSRGDAMWRLLMSDMNVYVACAADFNSTSTMGGEVSASQVEQESSTSSSGPQAMSEMSSLGSSKQNLVLPCPQNTGEPEKPTVVGISSLPSGKFSAPAGVQNSVSILRSAKGNVVASLSCVIEETSSSLSISSSLQEGKPAGGKKGHFGSSKREYILRQKSVHFEKSYRMLGTKAVIRASKNGGFGGFLLDQKSKAISDPTAANKKNKLVKKLKAVLPEASQADSSNDGPIKITNNTPAPLPVACTELSLSLPSIISSSNCGGSGVIEACSLNKQIDELLKELVPRVKDLEAQLQEWSDWAQQKVMQAARRLGKDKPELQTLRHEKEEVVRLKKEKQSLEENTRKKLAEMEIALSKASAQVQKATAEARDLEDKNTKLRIEMESAKLWAAESAVSCQEVSERETQTLKKFNSWERQKILLQEELATEKKKFSQLQQKLKQAKEHYNHIKAKWKQEEKIKDELEVQQKSERKEREQIEVSGRSKENALKLKAETELQRYRNDIKKLEQQIARLRQSTDSSKIAALKWGPNCLLGGRKECAGHAVSKLLECEEAGEEIQRERECVMCLTDEMSIVFLPCAHQVVCVTCNDLHEKQGMKECPSCRTLIEKRIHARSADS